jgi:chemotaxis regulatin CheY-phosphate phosphatase CheZ
MSNPNIDINGIESLEEVTDALLQGKFNQIDSQNMLIDTEGLLSNLAQKINTMVVNMKTVESPLASAGEQAPVVVSNAQNVVELMAQSTDEVLNKSDKLSEMAEDLDHLLAEVGRNPSKLSAAQENLTKMKVSIFDIIASQSYQDVARQKMEALILELNNIRDWLIEALVVLNIGKDDSPENIQKKTEILKEVSEASTPDTLKQDLVDDLLAEFGF